MKSEKVEKDVKDYTAKPEEYAAIYARKSTKLENNSLSSQASLGRQVIEKRNLFVYDVYEDEESATKYHPMHRPGFKRLLYDAMNNKFKTVVVFRRDRLARKVDDLLEIKNFFKKYGIKIIYSNQGEYQTNDDSYISSFIENIIMSVDELEPSILAQRIAAGKEQKRARGGFSGRIPYGYKKDVMDGKKVLLPDPPNSTIVQIIFYNFLKEVTDDVSFENFVEEIKSSYNANKFTKKSIVDMLLRPSYGGLITTKPKIDVSKTLIKNTSETFEVNKDFYRPCTDIPQPIVTSETWYDSLIKWRTITPQRNTIEDEEDNYLFKGLVQCNKCRKPIYLTKGIYKCLKECTTIPIYEFQDTLLSNILDDLLCPNNLKQYQDFKLNIINKDIEKLEKDIQTNKADENTDLFNIIKSYSNNKKPDYKKLYSLINSEKQTLATIDIKKQNAVKINIALEELDKISEIDNKVILINMFKRNIEISQELFTSIIKKITVNQSRKGISNGSRNFTIEYVK